MVILPTEKRFDWRHAPLVLMSIILLNVFIFISYQIKDGEKSISAVMLYSDPDFLSLEWPLFKAFLQTNNEKKLLEDLNEQYQQTSSASLAYVSAYILMRYDFYHYLMKEHRVNLINAFGDEGLIQRQKAHDTMMSLSALKHGLTPEKNNLMGYITHQFLHGDVFHLLGNLLFLIICGFAVEAAVGHLIFLCLYVVAGVVGGLLHVWFNLQSTIPLIGASGAISGVMAMYLMLFRLKKIEFFYWLFIFVGYFRAPALMILPFYISKELYQFYTSTGSNIAFMAHAGGFVAGAVTILLLLLFFPKAIDDDYIEEDQIIDPYQQRLADIYQLLERYRFAETKQALDHLIKDEGLSFDSAFLRYRLSSLDKSATNKTYQQDQFSLYQMKNLTDAQLKKVAKVWRDSDLQSALPLALKLNLAMQLSILPDPSDAVAIFDVLMSDNNQKVIDKNSLSILARKISMAYQRVQRKDKQQIYDEIADSLLQ